VAAGADGIAYFVSAPPAALPSVSKRDLEQAWEAAQTLLADPPARIFIFPGAEAPIELQLNDPDADAWAAAVDRAIGLDSAHGISVCLRLIALIGGLAQFGWAREWFGPKMSVRAELLTAASLAPLTEAGGFDETALRALLPAHRL